MHVYCVYHAMSKSPNNILFFENSRNKRPSNHFLTVSSVKSTRIFLLFLTVAYVSENINRTNYQYAIVSWDISRHAIVSWNISRHAIVSWDISRHAIVSWNISRHAIVYQSAHRGTQFHVGHYFILHNTRQGLS
jgi:hypothetical protein